jgi:hypothetical protein
MNYEVIKVKLRLIKKSVTDIWDNKTIDANRYSFI